MDLSKLDINDIAQNLDMGMVCFIHNNTMELVYYPDPDQFHDDVEEFWGEDMKKVEDNTEDYIEIQKMDSSSSFKIMEDYTATIKNKKLRTQLLNALEKKKPFRNWKYIIDDTGQEREDWFKFKQERMELWVSCHLDPQDKYDPETLYEIKSDVPEPRLQGLRTTIYKVPDLAEATDWYSRFLCIKPYFESEDYVGFNVGGFELGLRLSNKEEKHSESNAISYWAVEDLEDVMLVVAMSEVPVYEPIFEVGGGIRLASIVDPWGNIIGLIFNPNFEIDS